MPERKNYSEMEMVFPLSALFFDRKTGYRANLELADVHTIYLGIVNTVPFRRDEVWVSNRETSKVPNNIAGLKSGLSSCLQLLYMSVCTTKFHLLGRNWEDFSQI